MPHEEHEANRRSWNEATRAHNSHKGDQAAFFRKGGSTLFPEDLAMLGDIRGKTVIHLQCNAGQDTLSLAQMGATVTGVDISDEAIAFAQQLSAASGLPASFIRSDLYDYFEADPPQFDVAYVSYGALNWLSDLHGWARGVAKVLKPGGYLALVEFHPVSGILDDDLTLTPYPALGGERIHFEDGVDDYVAYSGDQLIPDGQAAPGVENFENPHGCYEYAWGIGDILGALLTAGLRLEHYQEYPYSNGFKPFPEMRELPGRRNAMPEGLPDLPLMFSLRAHKPTSDGA